MSQKHYERLILTYFSKFSEALPKFQRRIDRIDAQKITKENKALWGYLACGDVDGINLLDPEFRLASVGSDLRFDESVGDWFKALEKAIQAATVRKAMKEMAKGLDADPEGFLEAMGQLKSEMAIEQKSEWAALSGVVDSGSHKEAIKRVGFGLSALDNLAGGGAPKGRLTIIAARPGVGKSAISVSSSVARAELGAKTAVLSLEMDAGEYALRAISTIESVSQGEAVRLKRFKDLTGPSLSRIFVLDMEDSEFLKIQRAIRNIVMAEPQVDMVFIDYLQLISEPRVRENRNLEMTSIVQNLHRLAKSLKVSIVALSQLSRDVDGKNSRPMLKDLRESGAIEQAAAMAAFIHDPNPNRPDSRVPHNKEIVIRKNRSGPLGYCEIGFIPNRAQFLSGSYEMAGVLV